MAPLVLGSADVKLEEAIKGCDSRSGTEKVRLRQKLEQRRAGAARGTKEPKCTSGHVEHRIILSQQLR